MQSVTMTSSAKRFVRHMLKRPVQSRDPGQAMLNEQIYAVMFQIISCFAIVDNGQIPLQLSNSRIMVGPKNLSQLHLLVTSLPREN